jgi:LDH2 family malate/lactate/ureidoglycolate dehydrogenase
MTARYDAASLITLCSDILTAAGADRRDASCVAGNLVGANLRGVDSQGVLRMTPYVNWFTQGQIAKTTEPVIVAESMGTAVVDAQNGWGAPASVYAMELAIEKARKTGISSVGVRRSNHFGYAAHYGMMALEHDMIGFAFTNAQAIVAPWGARTSYFGTNPICVCIPAGEERPLVYDGATTVVAHGKIVLAHKEHRPIPPTWALDKSGIPTTDPAIALEGGSLMPMSTYKGSDLAMAVDILSGILPGAAFGPYVGALALWGNAANAGHFFMALDVKAFGDVGEFKSSIDKMIRDIRSLPLAEGMSKIYVPGEIEFDVETERTRAGIPVAEDVVAELQALAERFGVQMPWPARS